MKEKSAKLYIALITYAVVLFVLVFNLSTVFDAFRKFVSVLSPFFYGIVIAFVLNIPLKSFENTVFAAVKTKKPQSTRKLKRFLSVLSTYVFAALIIILIILFVFPQLSNSVYMLTNNIPGYISSLRDFAIRLSESHVIPEYAVSKVFEMWDVFLNKAGELVSSFLPMVFNFTKGITFGVFNFFLGVVLSVYMLFGKEKLVKNIKQLLYVVLPKKAFGILLVIGTKTNKTFQSFISGQLTEAAVLGVLCFLGMLLLKIPYALLISTIIALTSIIPVFGAFIGTIPSAFVIFMASPVKALWFVIFIIALQQFEGNIIYPRVVGTSIGLSGIWVLLAMIIGGSYFGFFGLLLGIPVFAVVYSLVSSVVHIKLKEKLKG